MRQRQRGLTNRAFLGYLGRSMVAVAQLVEPQIVVLVVAGSSPVGHPNILSFADWISRDLTERFSGGGEFSFSF